MAGGLSRPVRIGLWSLLGVVVLVIAAGVVASLSFDPDSLKPRIIAAVKQATGRDLVLQGHIRLALSLRPTLVVEDASFANPAGFSRPQMATVEQLDVQVALLPLLSRHVEIERLLLVKPDVILETDAQGRPNWQFAPAAKQPAQEPGAVSSSSRDGRSDIGVADVRVENGTLTWRDGRVGQSAVIDITSLHASAASPDANLHLSMSAQYSGTPFSLTAELGPLARLEEQRTGGAWPIQASLEAAGAKIAVTGTVSQPMQARGYRINLTANVPDLAALAPLLPGVNLPPLRELSLAAQIADSGAALPDISGLTLHVGRSDLTGRVAGLKLDRLDVAAGRLDQPMQISAQGELDNSPAVVTGTIGVPEGLLPPAGMPRPIPLDLSAQALGSHLTIKGTAGRDQAGRPFVQAEVASDHLDLDRLLAALPKAQAAPSPAAQGAQAAPAKPAASAGVIPDRPIPFDLLRMADADVKLDVAQAILGGATYRAISTHLDLHGGKLRLDPVSADLPEGHITGALSADTSQAAPAVALKLRIPALALQALLAAMKQPGYGTGNLQVEADLRGSGTTPHAIASSLDGSLGVAMTNGTLDDRLLGNALGSILREVNLLDMVGRGGTSQVQCFAVRLDATRGVATLRTLALASSLLTMEGNGSLNLGAETLDLHVRPQAKIAGTGVVVPLRISGPFRSPATVPDPAAAVSQNAGTVAGALLGNTTPLGAIAGALGGKQLLGAPGVDCGAALTAAVGTSAAPSSPAVSPAPQRQAKPPNAGSVLRQLFR